MQRRAVCITEGRSNNEGVRAEEGGAWEGEGVKERRGEEGEGEGSRFHLSHTT